MKISITFKDECMNVILTGTKKLELFYAKFEEEQH